MGLEREMGELEEVLIKTSSNSPIFLPYSDPYVPLLPHFRPEMGV